MSPLNMSNIFILIKKYLLSKDKLSLFVLQSKIKFENVSLTAVEWRYLSVMLVVRSQGQTRSTLRPRRLLK